MTLRGALAGGLIALLLAGPTGAAAAEVVAYTVAGHTIPQPLTTLPGDPARGRLAFVAGLKGNCLGCHRAPIPDELFHGDIGPDLAGIGARLTVPELRLRVVDAKRVNPETVMPAFHRVEGLHRVAAAWAGQPILTAQEVEDVVAYLATLK